MLPFQALETRSALVLDKNQPVHFVGIGGIGMSGLAKILAESGFKVSGSDLRNNENTHNLAELGVKIYEGHQGEQVPHHCVIIASTAVSSDNPEIQRAKELGILVYHRSDVLREILEGQTLGHQMTVGISGSHGKTSVTGMLGVALQDGIQDVFGKPTVIAGGVIPEFGTNALLGDDRKLAVAELDESDGTLIQYSPTHSVILNMELDHADHYEGGLDEFIETFKTYLSGLKPKSQVFFNWACPHTRALYESFKDFHEHSQTANFESIFLAPGDIFTGKEPQITYNLKNSRDYDRGCYLGYVYKKNKLMGELSMSVPGVHQLFNGLVAIAVGDQLGFNFETMARHLEQFSGMGRRFEKVGRYNGALLVDDYAHHPTEIQAMIRAGKEYQSDIGRFIAIFQPHRSTRLKQFWHEFMDSFKALNGDDILIIVDVHSAGESPIEGFNSQTFAQELKLKISGTFENIRYYSGPNLEALKQDLQSEIKSGDLVMTMGAGSITKLLRGWEEQ